MATNYLFMQYRSAIVFAQLKKLSYSSCSMSRCARYSWNTAHSDYLTVCNGLQELKATKHILLIANGIVAKTDGNIIIRFQTVINGKVSEFVVFKLRITGVFDIFGLTTSMNKRSPAYVKFDAS